MVRAVAVMAIVLTQSYREVNASGSLGGCNLIAIKKDFEARFDVGNPMELRDIEQKHLMVFVKNGAKLTLPFGEQNQSWLEFKRQFRQGDCIVFIESNSESWKTLSGQRGYVLIREGKAIISYIYERS